MSASPHIGMFLSAIEKLHEDYQSIDARVIAYNWDGNWINVASRFTLSPGKWKTPYLHMNALAKVSELYLYRDTLHITELERVLEIFRNGEFSAESKTILYKRWMNQRWEQGYSPAFYTLKRADDESWVGSKTFAYALRAGESGFQQFDANEGLRRVESKLATLPTPFVSLTDFATEFIGPLVVPNVWGYPSAEVSAPIRVRFVQPCQIEDGEAQYHFEMERGYKKSHLSIGFAAFSGGRAYKRGRASKVARVKQTPRKENYVGRIRFPSAAESVTLLLSYRGEEVDRQTLYRPTVAGSNIRMAVYEKTVPGFEKFNDGLASKDTKSRKFFEESIKLLFSFLGFSCVKPSTDDFVDLVAFSEDPEQFLLIECTTEAPGLKNKLDKLASRQIRIRRTTGTRPIALMATSISRDDISSPDRERATRDGIVLLGSENLSEMIDMADRSKTVGATMRYLRGLAPLGAF